MPRQYLVACNNFSKQEFKNIHNIYISKAITVPFRNEIKNQEQRKSTEDEEHFENGNKSLKGKIGNWKLHGRLVLTQIFFVQLTKILKLKQVSTIYGKFLDSCGTQLFKVEILNS